MLASCEGAPAEAELPLGHVEILGHRGWVVGPSPFMARSGAPSWRPTRTQLEAFERALVPYVRSQPPVFQIDPSVDLPTALDGYVRQYTGELRDGRRVVYVNLLCASFVEHLPGELTQMMTVSDGGECNCDAVFDPETSEMIRFGCAGDA